MRKLLALIPLLLAASLPGQQPSLQPTTTRVMAILTVKPGVREQMMKVMPEEVRATVRLYLDGKIDQWYARSDGKGVVFILECKQVEEAKALLEKLPLIKENFAEFEYMPLGPLTPLRLLAGPPAQ